VPAGNSRRLQVFLAGAYFVIAWISLVVINGILTFMLTPGGWTLDNQDIAAGFFNPGYLPALLLRTVVMFLVAGLSALLVAARIREDLDLKERVVRFATKWVVPAAILAPLFTFWYWTTLPGETVKLVEGGVSGLTGGKMEVITRALWLAGTAGAMIVLGTLVVAWRPRALNTAAATALLLTALLGIAGGEFFREMAACCTRTRCGRRTPMPPPAPGPSCRGRSGTRGPPRCPPNTAPGSSACSARAATPATAIARSPSARLRGRPPSASAGSKPWTARA
jgi:hypothetical protein